MGIRQAPEDTGLGVSFIASAVIHLAVFLLVLWLNSLTPRMTLQQTYYVDIVNLPVASPRAGSPTQKGNDAEQAPVPPVRAPEGPMTLPASPKPQATAKETQKSSAKNEDSAAAEEAFAEKLAKLEHKADSQHEQATLQALRQKVKVSGSGRSGMPAGSGAESGSDYTAYIQSRLKDAFRQTISYASRNPEVAVRLFIDPDGKISRRKVERSSGDRAFEISVLGAIELAAPKFTPPPNHKVFEGVFVFKPQGISPTRP